jgi:hypothetical protein
MSSISDACLKWECIYRLIVRLDDSICRIKRSFFVSIFALLYYVFTIFPQKLPSKDKVTKLSRLSWPKRRIHHSRRPSASCHPALLALLNVHRQVLAYWRWWIGTAQMIQRNHWIGLDPKRTRFSAQCVWCASQRTSGSYTVPNNIDDSKAKRNWQSTGLVDDGPSASANWKRVQLIIHGDEFCSFYLCQSLNYLSFGLIEGNLLILVAFRSSGLDWGPWCLRHFPKFMGETKYTMEAMSYSLFALHAVDSLRMPHPFSYSVCLLGLWAVPHWQMAEELLQTSFPQMSEDCKCIGDRAKTNGLVSSY